MKRYLIFSLILIAMLIFGCAGQSQPPAQQSQSRAMCNVSQPYSDTEYYNETEPYTDTECTQQKIMYSLEGTCPMTNNGTTHPEANCTIKNLDSVGGTFIVDVGFGRGFEGENGSITVLENWTVYVYPHSSKTVTTVDWNNDLEKSGFIVNSFGCICREASPSSVPTKQVCNDVTKYHDVQKSRTVTKYRTVEQPC